MLRRGFGALSSLVALVLLAGLASFFYLCWQINHTGGHDEARPVDAIIVLGARVQPDGHPGPDLRSRTLHGLSLFQQGLAPYLICTGGYRNDRLSAASVACDLAASQGVPEERLLLADGSMTTGEDAASVRELMDAHELNSAILVSHPLHLERARLLFEEQGIAVFPSPTNTHLAAIPWPSRVWLTVREAVGIIGIALERTGVPAGWYADLSRWFDDATAPPALGAE